MKRLWYIVNRGAERFSDLVLWCAEKAEPYAQRVTAFTTSHRKLSILCAVLGMVLICFVYVMIVFWDFLPFSDGKVYTLDNGDTIHFLTPEQEELHGQYLSSGNHVYSYDFDHMWTSTDYPPRILCKVRVLETREVARIDADIYDVEDPLSLPPGELRASFEMITMMYVEQVFFQTSQDSVRAGDLITVYSFRSNMKTQGTGSEYMYPKVEKGTRMYVTLVSTDSIFPKESDGKNDKPSMDLPYAHFGSFLRDHADYMLAMSYLVRWPIKTHDNDEVITKGGVVVPLGLVQKAAEMGIQIPGYRIRYQDDCSAGLDMMELYSCTSEWRLDIALLRMFMPVRKLWWGVTPHVNVEGRWHSFKDDGYPYN